MQRKTIIVSGVVMLVVVMGLFSYFKKRSSTAEPLLSDRTTGDCVVSETARGSKEYNDADAVCYIFKKLAGKDVTKEEIQHVVSLEADFRKTTTVDASMASLGDPVPGYIFQHQTMHMTQEKITRIYDAESYYLQFIGVIDKSAF